MEKEYVTVVVEVPVDPIQKGALFGVLRGDAYFHGARVTAAYLGDAISENELFERITNPLTVKQLRADVAQRHTTGVPS